MDIKDDIPIVFGRPKSRQRGVRARTTVMLQPSKTILQIARVGEGQRLGDLDDHAAFDEFNVWMRLCVFEFVGSGAATHDLDPGTCAVFDDGEEGESDPNGDAETQ